MNSIPTNKQMRERIKALEEIHLATRMGSNNPDDTIKAFIEKVGEYTACETLAALVQHYSWDGRIYPINIQWAQTWAFPKRLTEDAGTSLIHMCHLDQLATRARKLDIEQGLEENIVLRG